MKAAILVLSDPDSGSAESLGRLFNALAATYDFKQRGDDVTLMFQGAGTRWAREVVKQDHPVHELYKSVEDKVAGASCGCAETFGATGDVEQAGLAMLTDNAIPGTPGLPSLRDLSAQGYTILTF